MKTKTDNEIRQDLTERLALVANQQAALKRRRGEIALAVSGGDHAALEQLIEVERNQKQMTSEEETIRAALVEVGRRLQADSVGVQIAEAEAMRKEVVAAANRAGTEAKTLAEAAQRFGEVWRQFSQAHEAMAAMENKFRKLMHGNSVWTTLRIDNPKGYLESLIYLAVNDELEVSRASRLLAGDGNSNQLDPERTTRLYLTLLDKSKDEALRGVDAQIKSLRSSAADIDARAA